MCSSFGSLCLPWEDLLAEWYTVYCAQGIVASATLAGTGASEYWHVMLKQGHHAITTDGFVCWHVVESTGPSSMKETDKKGVSESQSGDRSPGDSGMSSRQCEELWNFLKMKWSRPMSFKGFAKEFGIKEKFHPLLFFSFFSLSVATNAQMEDHILPTTIYDHNRLEQNRERERGRENPGSN